MTEHDDLFDAIDAKKVKRNRAQRRLQVRYGVGRQLKKNLFGWGRWRRLSTLTTTPGRYDEPFADRDQG
jgi:hypothetical protein